MVQANGLTFKVNRFRTHAAGERPIVVCVHGLAVVDNAAPMFVVGFHLAKHAEVITYDLRGHGRSDKPDDGYAVSNHAGDLLALLDALDIHEPVHLLGMSYGGAIATVAAMRAPERFSSLILLDGQCPVKGWQQEIDAVLDEFFSWETDAAEKGLTGDAFEDYIASRLAGRYQISPRRAKSATRQANALFQTTTLRADMQTEPDYGRAEFSRITCPVLGIYGDKSILYWMMEPLAELFPNITLHTIEGADHLDVYWRLDDLRPLVADVVWPADR